MVLGAWRANRAAAAAAGLVARGSVLYLHAPVPAGTFVVAVKMFSGDQSTWRGYGIEM